MPVCGIAGLYSFIEERSVEEDVLRRMTASMIHRGPDAEGLFCDGRLGFGHRRLSIIDPGLGHQPLCNEDGTIWLVFNGEIYNYRELRENLLARGHRFKTNSDTEVIVHLYEDLEDGCVHALEGMFAFALWDRPRQRLVLARDRLGIKPLYYLVTSEKIAFASELRALLAVPGFQPAVDVNALHDYLTFRYTVTPRTMLAGVRKLPPGHVLLVERDKVSLRQYWELDFGTRHVASEEELIEEFERRFRHAVARHLVADVPVGILLSGGLDSTAVTAIAAESQASLRTFSVGFADAGGDADERAYARAVARHFRTQHDEIGISCRQYVDALERCVMHMDDAMADPAAIPLYYVSELAKKSVTVVLSGEGSDEFLGGYSFWTALPAYQRAEMFRRIPEFIRRRLVDPLNQRMFRSASLARYLQLAARPASEHFQILPTTMTHVFSEEAKRRLYGIDRMALLPPSDSLVAEAYRKAGHLGWLDQMLYVYAVQWLPDDLLLKADKMTMAHSLELRVPFLDDVLVKFLSGLPAEMKLRRAGNGSFTTKYILRHMLAGRVPPEVVSRKKVGFKVPLTQYFTRELKTMAWDILTSREFEHIELFSRQEVGRLLHEHESGIADHHHELWLLLVFALWHKGVVTAPPAARRFEAAAPTAGLMSTTAGRAGLASEELYAGGAVT
jgi:asparagine synthase (glutamine-hydrolysing)